MSNVVSFEELKKRQEEHKLYQRWLEYYQKQKHEDLLEALVFEHENNFPLRNSPEMIDRLRHKALVEILNKKAQTDFLKHFLQEIR
jgi:hypothetical protein